MSDRLESPGRSGEAIAELQVRRTIRYWDVGEYRPADHLGSRGFVSLDQTKSCFLLISYQSGHASL